MNSSDNRFYEFAQFQFEVETCRLLCAGELVPLPQKAAALLHLFLQQPGKVCRKEDLLLTLWRDEIVEDANLNQTIYLLRKALNQSNATGQFIETIPKIGYRFVAEVRPAQVFLQSEPALALAELPLPQPLPKPAGVAPLAAPLAAAPPVTPVTTMTVEAQPHPLPVNGFAPGVSLRETVLSLDADPSLGDDRDGRVGAVVSTRLTDHSVDHALLLPALSTATTWP